MELRRGWDGMPILFLRVAKMSRTNQIDPFSTRLVETGTNECVDRSIGQLTKWYTSNWHPTWKRHRIPQHS